MIKSNHLLSWVQIMISYCLQLSNILRIIKWLCWLVQLLVNSKLSTIECPYFWSNLTSIDGWIQASHMLKYFSRNYLKMIEIFILLLRIIIVHHLWIKSERIRLNVLWLWKNIKQTWKRMGSQSILRNRKCSKIIRENKVR